MYVESGIKDMEWCAIRGGMNKLSAVHTNDFTVFQYVIRYGQQGHGNADCRCLLLFKGVCTLCNNELEVHARET